MESAPWRYVNIQHENPCSYISFSSPSSYLVFPELTQASECLRLTATKGSNPRSFPSLSGPWRSVFPDPQVLHPNLSRRYFHRLQFGAVCGKRLSKVYKHHASKDQKWRRTLQGQGPIYAACTGAESTPSLSTEEVRSKDPHGPVRIVFERSDNAFLPRCSTTRAAPPEQRTHQAR